ncbi:MAG TPA: hypothetical protein VFH08_17800 [Chitinophagaceae bacterium]|nr:hypothetical protein [Chitinophagaceae bacterium]
MEVHQHAHHEGKKNWKSYFWEFLMLFLAVFCGFLAEYKLEHIVEHQKGIQYIHSLEEDIQVDTAKLSALITEFEQKQSGLDSMLESIKGISSSSNSNGLYNYLKYTTDYPDFIYTDRTMQQLKNAGGLRMIPDKGSADKIVMYDAAIKRILLTEELELNPNQQTLKKLTIAIFDFSNIPDFENKFSSGDFGDHLSLLRYDKYTLKEYYNEIWIMNRKVGQHTKNLVKAKSTAEQLLHFLKEKY